MSDAPDTIIIGDEADPRIDPTLMLANLRLTPAERLDRNAAAAQSLNELRSAARVVKTRVVKK
jgi:hypothetical protein